MWKAYFGTPKKPLLPSRSPHFEFVELEIALTPMDDRTRAVAMLSVVAGATFLWLRGRFTEDAQAATSSTPTRPTRVAFLGNSIFCTSVALPPANLRRRDAVFHYCVRRAPDSTRRLQRHPAAARSHQRRGRHRPRLLPQGRRDVREAARPWERRRQEVRDTECAARGRLARRRRADGPRAALAARRGGRY